MTCQLLSLRPEECAERAWTGKSSRDLTSVALQVALDAITTDLEDPAAEATLRSVEPE